MVFSISGSSVINNSRKQKIPGVSSQFIYSELEIKRLSIAIPSFRQIIHDGNPMHHLMR